MIATVSYGFLPGLKRMTDTVDVVAIASRTRARADGVARDWDIPAVYDDVGSMLAHADLDAVLNVTTIDAHFETSKAILAASKHLITDKPLAQTMAECDELLALAQERGVLIVSAPGDMLRNEWQEAKRLVKAGALGKIAFARVQSSHAGPAGMAWPADPTWFYQKGSGPLLDMGAYGLTRITGVLGPAKRVTAMSGITVPIRRARGGAFDGLEIPVTEPDNTLLLLDFGGATFATVDASFNVVGTRAPAMEIYGLEGSMTVNRPDADILPGQYPIELFRIDAGPGLSGWITPRTVGRSWLQDRQQVVQRATLVEHLVECLATGQPPIAGPEHARHVMEIMLTAQSAAEDGRTVTLETSFPY